MPVNCQWKVADSAAGPLSRGRAHGLNRRRRTQPEFNLKFTDSEVQVGSDRDRRSPGPEFCVGGHRDSGGPRHNRKRPAVAMCTEGGRGPCLARAGPNPGPPAAPAPAARGSPGAAAATVTSNSLEWPAAFDSE